MTLAAAPFEIALMGERVILLPERALYLPAYDTLLVADLHWGKAAAFRAAHVPVPTGTTATDLARLTHVLQQTGAREVVILGDLLHAKTGRHADTLLTIAAWRREHAHVRLRLVRGNHDTHAGDPPASLDIDCVDAPWMLGPFACAHHPEPSTAGYVLAGHLHPHVAMNGRGRQRAVLPCFVVGTHVAILPAFASFTGKGAYTAARDDSLYAIVDDEVLAVG